MISGIHAIFHTQNADEVRDFLADVLELPSVNAGGGYLIFAAPPTELAVHESEGDSEHELFLACDDIEAATAALSRRGIDTTPVSDQGWGLITQLTLPGGDTINLYQPRHEHPHRRTVSRARKSKAKIRAKSRPAARAKARSKGKTAKGKSRTSPRRKGRRR